MMIQSNVVDDSNSIQEIVYATILNIEKWLYYHSYEFQFPEYIEIF